MLQEPCMSFVLKDVVCSQCNNSRDLDLCRDPDLQVSCLLETASSAYPMLSRAFCKGKDLVCVPVHVLLLLTSPRLSGPHSWPACMHPQACIFQSARHCAQCKTELALLESMVRMCAAVLLLFHVSTCSYGCSTSLALVLKRLLHCRKLLQ